MGKAGRRELRLLGGIVRRKIFDTLFMKISLGTQIVQSLLTTFERCAVVMELNSRQEVVLEPAVCVHHSPR